MKPLIIAHRGSSAEAPENTLTAFKLAAEDGADGIELDVHLSQDKVVMVNHDQEVVHPDGRTLTIRESTLETLKEIDVGVGEKMPTLAEVFEQCGGLFKVINVEIKSMSYFTDGIEHEVLQLIKQYQLENKVVISSFNPICLLHVKRINPKIPVGYLVEPSVLYQQFLFWPKICKASTINLEYAWISAHPKKLLRYQKLKKNIWVWTVNSEQSMRKWIDRGVHAIITNYPGRLKKLLD